MKRIKGLIQNINDTVCAPNGLLRGVCKESTKPGNEVMLGIVALLAHYMFPIAIIISIIVFVLGNGGAAMIILWIAYFNPLALLAFIPVVVVDVVIAVIFMIVIIIITVVYWIYFFKHVGIFALLPLAMWLIGFIFSFVPYIGGMISVLISITPWMAIAVVAKWISYYQGTILDMLI